MMLSCGKRRRDEPHEGFSFAWGKGMNRELNFTREQAISERY